jgi:hypothetical protein
MVQQIGDALLLFNVVAASEVAALLKIGQDQSQEYTGITPPGSKRYQTNSPSPVIVKVFTQVINIIKASPGCVELPNNACVVLERFLRSDPGCPMQDFHADHSEEEARLGHASMLLALQENTRIRSADVGSINIPVGSVFFWPGRFFHGGHAYDEVNIRAFCKVVGSQVVAKYNHSTYEELVHMERDEMTRGKRMVEELRFMHGPKYARQICEKCSVNQCQCSGYVNQCCCTAL